LVAVGTAIADRPPHRSRRALLTHRAPPSGSGVEAVTGQWVQYPDRREEAVGEAGELLPAHKCTLAAPLERLEPAPSHLVEVPPQAWAVSGRYPLLDFAHFGAGWITYRPKRLVGRR